MNRFLYFILLLIITFNGCSSDKNIRKDMMDIIDVSIEQGGNIINIIDDTAEIRRTGFSLKFRFTQQDSILINASFQAETFNNAKEGLPLQDLAGFRSTGIAEELFNKDSVIYVSNDSPNFWYYTDDSDNRFNNVLKNENGYLCTREINGVIDLDGSAEKVDLIKIKQKEIFLVIIKSEWNEDYTKMIEKNRKIIKLKFIL
ncbi:MAG: hypothetical protein CVV49_10905 [Spirochaetae bacterium HGW-Spirochaetae-5]|nr:MAG: hypothetical protein CVV49_10905 [Spirochaetae bacterium HGW-Spirochaetae-5]